MKCPYCNGKVELKSCLHVYKKYYSEYVIVCENYPSCDSYVGTHKNGKPLGRLANKELRQLKIEAHLYFDSLWKHKKNKGLTAARFKAYKWLSGELGLDVKETHIGYFDIETTKKVIKICKPYYNKITGRN